MKLLKLFLKSNYSAPFNRFFIVCFLLQLLAVNSFSQPKVEAKPAVTKTLLQKSFAMCEVMPGTEVASKSPFTIPFKSMEAWPTAGIKTGCRYIFKSDNDEAGITIGLTDLGSNKNALTSYKNAYNASKDLWDEAPASAIVLRDTGFFAGKDECGVKFHIGKYILDINFKGQFPDVSDEQKKQAGITLAGMVIERLKYLWKQN
jgi:hypothetical protein